MPRRFLVLGGSGSGKSAFAQQLAQRCGHPVTYLATGERAGPEMDWRIRQHRAARPPDWRTIEAPRGLAAALEAADDPAPVVLLEDIGSLVGACLPAFEERDGQLVHPQETMETAHQALVTEIDNLLAWCKGHDKHLVVVSSEVGMGVLPTTVYGRLYKDVIGEVNQRLADLVDRCFLVIAGTVHELTDQKDQTLALLDQLFQSEDSSRSEGGRNSA